jgi:hypothetical protein
MAKERKKVEKEIVPEVKVRKRVEKEVVPEVTAKKRTEAEIPKPLINEDGISGQLLSASDTKPRRSEDKYIRIVMGAKPEERKEITDKLAKGEIVFGYYGIDGDDGYHYYRIIKK